jgi:hypothetical protein
MLPSIASVAIAFAGDSSLDLPDRYLTAAGRVDERVRTFLIQGMLHQRKFKCRLPMRDLMTLQTDWSNRVRQESWSFNVERTGRLKVDLAARAQSIINKMNGAPLANVMKLLGTQSFAVEIEWNNTSVEAGILLLRGSSSEFYRPLRQALREAITNEKAVVRVMKNIRPAMTIWPADFEPQRFSIEAVNDPVTSFLSLAMFADKARVLETLMAAACEVAPQNTKLKRVMETYRSWDRTICGGRSSIWRAATSR